jgi:dolichol-phosphate mannosyltransferase
MRSAQIWTLGSIFYMEKLKSASRQMSNYIIMLNPLSRALTDDDNIKGSNMISVVLMTQNALTPTYQPPQQVMSSIPKEISREILVVHYKFRNNAGIIDKEPESTNYTNDRIIHVRVEGEFALAVKRGVELSNGKFILVMDADHPYSEEVIPELITELIQNRDSIIVVSRFVEGACAQSMSLVHNAMRKGARVIAKYGLKVKNVKDPMSTCFAFSRHVVRDISFEGKGNDALLELLVKVNNKNSNVPVKEIPIKQQGTATTRKVNFNRVLNYSRAVWDLYRYGEASKHFDDGDIEEQKKHRSILFLSKAGRFFTVGASGLIVNYTASFLLATIIPSIWYIHSTLFGIILSITSNFLLNKIWTFEDRDFSPKHFFRQYSLFMALCTLGAVIQLSLVYLFVEYSHIQYAVSLIVTVAIASLSNFLLNKKITFGEKIWE